MNQYFAEYVRLLDSGSVSAGVYVLSSTSIAAFRPLAAAALGIANPVDAAVRAYAAYRYRTVVAFFDNAALPADPTYPQLSGSPKPFRDGAGPLGANWKNAAPINPLNRNFTFVATAAQREEFLGSATIWTEEELLYAVNDAALTPARRSALAIPMSQAAR